VGSQKDLDVRDSPGVPGGEALRFLYAGGGVIGQGVHLQVGPEGLDGVELWGVGPRDVTKNDYEITTTAPTH
jgi:hypothetical protein